MAVAERKDCKDYISIYLCSTWAPVKQFKVDSSDLADIAWAPDGSAIAVWDSVLDYRLLIYSPDGRMLARYQAYENALGIRSVCWSPSSQFISIGSYDQKLRVLNHITWKVLGEFPHPQEVTNNPVFAGAIVYKETAIKDAQASEGGSPTHSRYVVVEDAGVAIASAKAAPDKPNPKMGVALQGWSADNRLVFTKNANMPRALWVWDISKLTLSALVMQLEPIKLACWDPSPARPPRLALCTANGKIYFWRPSGCSCVTVPAADFAVQSIEWAADGTSLALIGKESFCCCYLPEDW